MGLDTLAWCLALSAVPPVSPIAAPEGGVRFRGEVHALDDLPEAVDAEMRAALADWSGWAAEHEYELGIDDDGRVLVLSAESERRFDKTLELVRDTSEVFDELLPAPPRDAEEEPVVVDWGSGIPLPDRHPIVLARLASPSDLDALLAHMAELHPYLAGWAETARGGTGFVDTGTQVGCWLDAPPDIEIGDVWRSDNELVDRLALLLVDRRFGQLPDWLRTSLAWYHEMAVHGDIYSFPSRNEFVGVGEHAGWKNELKRTFKKRKKEPLELSEFAGWRRARWDGGAAPLAWGFVEFLAAHHREALPAMLEDLRLYYKEHSRLTHDDGTWELVPGYVVPVEAQAEIFARHAGDDVFDQASEFFRSWDKYKPDR